MAHRSLCGGITGSAWNILIDGVTGGGKVMQQWNTLTNIVITNDMMAPGCR